MKKIFMQIVCFLFASTLLAQEKHPFHEHHIEAFIGGAKEYRGQEETTHVVGLEYQYRISQMWAIGGSLEALGDQTARDRAYIIAAAVYLTDHWQVFAGPGYEESPDHGAYFMRVGTGYGFGIGDNVSLTPKIMVDVIEAYGPTLIVGFALGYGF